MTKKHYTENKELWVYHEPESGRYLVQKPVIFSESFASLQFIDWFDDYTAIVQYANTKRLTPILKGNTW